MRITAILLALALVTIAATVTVWSIFSDSDAGGTTSTAEPPEIIDGEDIYRNNAVAYPIVDALDITRITVNNNNKQGQYTLVRSDTVDGDFLFTYIEDGRALVYYPSICDLDSEFEYESLYAIETELNNYGLSKLSYLTSALEVAYFGERIELPEDSAEREALLKEFGFGGESCSTVVFDYVDDNGETHTRKIEIGGKTLTGTGYYFRVDDRDYVYNSLSNYYDYAMMGFYSFVNSALVAEGLIEDSTLEPIYTPEFTHWRNEIFEEEGELVQAGAEVIITANMVVPIDPSEYLEDPNAYYDHQNGYTVTGFEDMTVNLSTSTSQQLKDALINKAIGKYYDVDGGDKSSAIILTLPADFNVSRLIELAPGESVKYSYEIVEIEAIVEGGDDIIVPGTAVGEHNIIKVAYYYTADGKAGSPILSHAILDLTSDTLPDGVADELRSRSVGSLEGGGRVKFDINYTTENSNVTNYELKLTEIVGIYNSDEQMITEVTEDATVVYRYTIYVDGAATGQTYTASVDLSAAEDETDLLIKEKIVGKKVSSNLSISFKQETEYSEIFEYFRTYEISEIKYFVVKTEVISFSFLTNSERDPYYGDSIYENMTDGYDLYGINNNVADHILKLVGGIGENTSQSVGLQGIETVSVGITPEKLRDPQYGNLYSNILYFELPRGLIEIDSGDEDIINDWTSYEVLPFTIYIGEIQDDGTRYVASDLYDVIVKASNDVFFFVDETFVDFWARKNLLMTDVAYMQQMKLEFYMEDFHGLYDLDIIHKETYLTDKGLVIGTAPESYYDTFDRIDVKVTASGDCTSNLLVDSIADSGKSSMTLEDLYLLTLKEGEGEQDCFPDTVGTSYFKEFIKALFYVTYEGAMDADEQEDAIANYPMLMKLSLKIDTDKDGDEDDEDFYCFEFYRCDDRRVMVRLYEEDDEGNIVTKGIVSDFYVSTHAFKKTVQTFVSLLNGERFDIEESYPD